MNLVFKN